MTSLIDPVFKTKYQKCKYRVKKWESEFMEKNSRKPNRNDIKNADMKIKESYKVYWELKTQALEETLLDITFSDDVEANVSANQSTNDFAVPEVIKNPETPSTVEESAPLKNVENILPENNPSLNPSPVKSPSKSSLSNVKGVWGNHLSVKNTQKEKILVGRSSSFQLSQKKFSFDSFPKRNPRKSLSVSRIKSKTDLNKTDVDKTMSVADEPDEVKEKDELGLVKSAFGTTVKVVHEELTSINSSLGLLQNKTSWIDKFSSAIVAPERKFPTETGGPKPERKRLSGGDSGIESMDSIPGRSEPVTDSEDDFVANSDEEETNQGTKRVRNWRKHLNLSVQAKRPRLEVEEDVDNRNETEMIKVDTKPVEKEPEENEEVAEKDVKRQQKRKTPVYMKDPEPKVPVKKVRKVAARKGKKQSLDDKIKNTPTELKENPDIPTYNVESVNVVPRFKPEEIASELNQTTVDTGTITSNDKQVGNNVNATKVKKLEAKIASGGLNDNFVRVNLKKKVFVRGKKNFNYSKYKKNEWKNKKKELASGGGSLDLADLAEKNKCFLCGESGHFQRNCPNNKCDGLLPLEQIPDYPSLEEAEQMASKKAIEAHLYQFDRIPKCSTREKSGGKTLVEQTCKDKDVEYDEYTFNDEDFEVSFDNLEDVNGENQEEKEGNKKEENVDKDKEETKQTIVCHQVPKELIDKLSPRIKDKIEPLYSTKADGSLIDTPDEVFEALKLFGHSDFRTGQEKAIMRILSGQSTLVTLSTGSGKSLCYQLPAYLYSKRSQPSLTLVVSPLVSLMDDQVTGIPNFLKAAALHTGQTAKVREKIIDRIKDGNIDILMLSPEAIVSSDQSNSFGSILKQLPPISFVCIDEAHCISQWSHNFRPSYLMVCHVLIEKLGVNTILGLTATSTTSTSQSIVKHLNIHDGLHGVISDIPLPKNLIFSVSRDEHRDRALIDLLKSKRFEECYSIIIYCTRRDECTRIAGFLRASLKDNQDKDQKANKNKVSSIAEAYHAGLAASRRKIIQKNFMNGNIRIVVATVAFGMGINKSNIRSVIHYNMPSTFEGYVQEVGRAGRDNLTAYCHLFLDSKDQFDKWELRRHIYANGVDRHTIRRLLQRIFLPCSCSSNGIKCPGHEVAIAIDDIVRALDITAETISTLLCYLELHSKKFIKVLSSVYVNAKVSSYSGSKGLKKAAQSSPPLAMAIALDKKKGITHENSAFIEFPVVDIAAAIGWDSGIVKSHLKKLEWESIDGKYKRTDISVKYDTLGLRVRAPGDLTDVELDEALDELYERTKSQETSAYQQLEIIHYVLNKYSHNNVYNCLELGEEGLAKSEQLTSIIRQYFHSDTPLSIQQILTKANDDDSNTNTNTINDTQLISDIRNLIVSYKDNNFTGRAIARIFHGIQSPNYQAPVWCRCRFWRSHLNVDFNYILQLATKEILAMR